MTTTAPRLASRSPVAQAARRVLGAPILAPLRNFARPLRPLVAALGLVDPLPHDRSDDLRGWDAHHLQAWYARPAVSGTPERAIAGAERLLALDAPYPGLLLFAGDVLLDHGLLRPALTAYLRARTFDDGARYHFGQKLFDYVRAGPGFEDLAAVAELAATPGDMVPDLASAVLAAFLAHPDRLVEPRVTALAHQVVAVANRGAVLDLGNQALADGGHDRAIMAYHLALLADPHDVLTRLQIGVTHFLAGRYRDAERHFAVMETTREAEKARWGVSETPVTIMHATWLQAIGHIACLDTYVKAMELGWIPKQRSVLAFDARRPPTGWPLLRFWARHLEVIAATRDLGDVVDERVFGAPPAGEANPLEPADRDRRRVALMSFFWSGADGQGRVRWYGPLGSEVQRAWRAAGREPLLALDPGERDQFRTTLAQVFGLPKDAWFVLLHVREPGYKAQWEGVHAYTRNANIDDYDAAIQYVIDRGGWVIRGGDPSMRPIRPRANVIDYATSPFRTPELDILLCAECRFFLGTNSGFSLVPPLFGRRCALTNWSPLGTPNWYPDDLFIPKLVRRRDTGELLSFEEMYRTLAGWSQFQRDFQGDVEKLDNSPDDLLDATAEMFDELEGRLTLSPDDLARRARFDAITQAAGGYPGSRPGSRFLARYAQLL